MGYRRHFLSSGHQFILLHFFDLFTSSYLIFNRFFFHIFFFCYFFFSISYHILSTLVFFFIRFISKSFFLPSLYLFIIYLSIVLRAFMWVFKANRTLPENPTFQLLDQYVLRWNTVSTKRCHSDHSFLPCQNTKSTLQTSGWMSILFLPNRRC